MSSPHSISFKEIAQKHNIPAYQIPTLQLRYEEVKNDTEALHKLMDSLNPSEKNTIAAIIGAIYAGKLTDENLFSNDLSFTPREIKH